VADATAIAIVGISVSGGVGLAAPSLNAWWAARRQRRQLRHERTLADIAELREVLDAGSGSIRRAVWAVAAVTDYLRALPRFDPSPRRRRLRERDARDLLRNMRSLVEDAALVSGQIALRLGREHAVYQRYDEAAEAMIGLLRRLQPFSAQPWRWMLLRRRHEARLERALVAGEKDFVSKRAAYVDAAQRLVAARLDEPGDSQTNS
jgi:hypothetical protein